MYQRHLKYTNSKGESIDFGRSSPFVIDGVEGLGDVDADVQTQRAPFQDGSTYLDTVLEEREIAFTVRISGQGDAEISQRREQLARIFNPKLGLGVLEYQYGETKRLIEAVATHIPSFPKGRENRSLHHQIALIDLLAPNPYWKSEGVDVQPTFEPLFQFPFEGEFEMGISRDERLIVNQGDTATPLIIEFFGPAMNPTVTNETTGEFIKINQSLAVGECMRINTSDGEKSVAFIDGQGIERNVFNWIDLDSSFFKLIEGENSITYTADSNIQGAVVNFYYQERFNAL